MPQRFRVLRAALALLAGACGQSHTWVSAAHDSGERAEPDAATISTRDAAISGESSDASVGGTSRDASSARDASSTLQACALDAPKCIPLPNRAPPPVLLDASSFGAGARVIAVDHSAILIARENAAFQVARLNVSGDTPEWVLDPNQHNLLSAPAAGITPRALASGSVGDEGNAVFVLGCDSDARDDTTCRLFRSARDQDSLSEWSEAQLPSDFLPTGLTIDRDLGRVCVFGNGLLCFHDGWQIELPIGADLQLNAVSFDGRVAVAVGNHGRYATRTRDSNDNVQPWQEQPALDAADLIAAASYGAHALVSSSTGKLWLLSADAAITSFVLCSSVDPVTMILFSYNDAVTLITRTGRHFQGMVPSSLCEAEPYASGSVLGITRDPCGLSDNEHVLTARQVVGYNWCPLD